MAAKKKKLKPKRDLALARSHFWVSTAIFQGERLMKLIAFQDSFDPYPAGWTADQRREWDAASNLLGGHAVSEAEGYFFVYALRQARNWLGYARAHDRMLAK